jgi:lysozyme-like protein
MATRYTFAQLKNLWVQAGGSAASSTIAAAIAMAESGGNPDSINTANSNGTIDRGLWQINSIHGSQSTLDPLANARAAVAISKGGTDWRPWCVAWSNGRCGGTFLGTGAPVLRYLPQGSTITGVIPTGSNQPATLTSAGIPIPPNPFGVTSDGVNAILSLLFGSGNNAVQSLAGAVKRWLYHVALVVLGIAAIIMGLIMLVLFSRPARQIGETALQLGGQRVGARAANAVVGPPPPIPVAVVGGPPPRVPRRAASPVPAPASPAPSSPPARPSYRSRHQMMTTPGEAPQFFRAGGSRKAPRARAAVRGRDLMVPGEMPPDPTYRGRHNAP